MNLSTASVSRSQSQPSSFFSQSAVLDSKGREIPITEQMILQACRELDAELNKAARQHSWQSMNKRLRQSLGR